MKRLFFAAIILSLSLPTFATETLRIDFRYNLNADDGKNYLHWRTKDTKIKDSFDAVSGASKAMSTKQLREMQFADKKKLFPKGLYALLLFAVSPAEQAKIDSLTVTPQGKQLAISFMHRGNAYKITSDEKGRLNTNTSFSMAQGVATNSARVFTIKDTFLAPDKTLDQTKLIFSEDVYDEGVAQIWNGKLKATCAGGILKISGTLKKIPKPEKQKTAPTEEAKSPPPSDSQNSSDATNPPEAEPPKN
ncbi:MAG: hypothetical protein IJP62_01545 [Treponema sp.]|nr:hypothetical protein [Treponema sp.]